MVDWWSWWNCPIVESWNGEVVESSNRRMVELVQLIELSNFLVRELFDVTYIFDSRSLLLMTEIAEIRYR